MSCLTHRGADELFVKIKPLTLIEYQNYIPKSRDQPKFTLKSQTLKTIHEIFKSAGSYQQTLESLIKKLQLKGSSWKSVSGPLD